MTAILPLADPEPEQPMTDQEWTEAWAALSDDAKARLSRAVADAILADINRLIARSCAHAA